MSDRAGARIGVWAPPLQELTAAKGRQHHNSRQNEWPQREVQAMFGAFRNVNVFNREPTDLVHI